MDWGRFLAFFGGKEVTDSKVLLHKVVELVELHLESMLELLESFHERIRPENTLTFANFACFFVAFRVFDG